MAERVEQRSVSVRIDGKEIENTLKNLTREMGRLKDETSRAAEGTSFYVERALSLAQADQAAKHNRDQVKAIAQIWDKMPEDVKISVQQQQTELRNLRSEYVSLIKQGEKLDSVRMITLKKDIVQVEDLIASTVTAFSHLADVAENSVEGMRKSIAEARKEMERATFQSKEYYEKLKKLEDLEGKLKEHKEGIDGVTKAWYDNIPAIKGAMAAAAALFALDHIVQYGRELYKVGVEMDNIARKSALVLQEQFGRISEAAKKNASDVGLAREQYIGAATDMTVFLQSQKFSREEAAKMSTEVVNLSGVLAQFQGGGLEKTTEAMEAIKGAFAEDVEQLAKFNIAISENVVQSKMMELGLDKANAATQQHGRGMIILKMITEGAAAQNATFAGSADGMVRSQARVEAMLQSISNNLAKFFIPLFEKALSAIEPVANWLGILSEKMSGLVNPTKATSEAYFDQKNKVTALEKELPKLLNRYDALTAITKPTKKEQKELHDIIQQVGEIVPTTKIEVDNYGKALRINAGAAREFLVAQQTLSKYLNADAIEAEGRHIKELEYAQSKTKAQIELINTGKVIGTSGPFGVDYRKDTDAKTKAVNDLNAELIKTTTILEGARLNEKRLKGEKIVETFTPDKVDMSGESIYEQNLRKKKEEEIKKHLEDLRQALEKHNSDVNKVIADDEASKAVAIREKYRKDIELAEEMERVKGAIGKEAHDIKVKFIKLRDAEIRDLYVESLKKIQDDTEKFLNEENLKRLSADDQEIQRIYDKYQKQIEIAKRIENDITNTTEAQRSQAHIQRLALEQSRETEYQTFKKQKADEKNFKAAEEYAKDIEENRQFFEKLKVLEAEYNQYVVDTKASLKTVKVTEGSIEELELIKVQIQSKADAEIEQERLKFERLIELNRGYEERIASMKTAHEAKLKNIQDVANADKTKKEQEFVTKTIAGYNALAGAVGNAFTALGDIIGAETEEAAALQKVATLAKIVFDTASAISGITAAATVHAGNPIAYAIAVASGIATVLANIATAKNVLSTAPKVKQKADGSTVGVVGDQDGQYYEAFMGGEAKTGMVKKPNLFLAGEKGEEYVIANPELKIPEVANFLPVIEAHRQRRKGNSVRQFEDGGTVGNTNTSTSSPSPASNTEGALIAVATKMMAVLEKMEKAFEKGVVFTWEDLVEFGKRQSTLKNIQS